MAIGILRGNFITLNAYVRNKGESQWTGHPTHRVRAGKTKQAKQKNHQKTIKETTRERRKKQERGSINPKVLLLKT